MRRTLYPLGLSRALLAAPLAALLLAPAVIAAPERDLLAPGAAGQDDVLEGRRVALVIGNGAYRATSPLAGTARDARLIAEALQAEGFEVSLRLDLPQAGMSDAITAFAGRLRGADVGLFYYAGHGVQHNGQNFLIPVDADIGAPAELGMETTRLQDVAHLMQESGSRLNIVVLDACRNNPFSAGWPVETRASTAGGLKDEPLPARTASEGGDFVLAYAASPGQTATDEGVYARSLAARIQEPDVELARIFRYVRQDVAAQTGGVQIPWYNESRDPVDFYPGGRIAPAPAIPVDLSTIQSAVAAERERQMAPAREAQAAELAALSVARQKTVATEWATLRGVLNAPEGADPTEIAMVEQRLAVWKEDTVIARARQVTLSGSVVVNGQLQPLSGSVDLPPQTKAVSHTATIQQAEAWLSVARAQKPAAAGNANASSGSGNSAVSGADWTSPTLGKMKWIPAGTFTMGSPTSEEGRSNDETQHRVTLTRGFWMMEHEVTQGEWQAVMGSNPSRFHNTTYPVEQVSWEDIQIFIQKVSARDGVTYRLPTEAEWEYAARGGQSYLYAGNNKIDMVAWYYNNSGGTPHPVCQKQRNGYGLCDMSGNVEEWVQDWYGTYPGDASDYVNLGSGSGRVVRGGSCYYSSEYARVAGRSRYPPDDRNYTLGFRLVRSL